MKQGTVSVLVGCHSIIHSFFVLMAWIKLNRRLPKLWQLVCIFLHDIGHIGTNYLDNFEEKANHWKLGAKIGQKLFGKKAFYFLAGHCEYSGYAQSELYKADKYSWYIAPKIWIWWNTIVEPKLAMGYNKWEAVEKFKVQVINSIESGKYSSTHQMYLTRCGCGYEK